MSASGFEMVVDLDVKKCLCKKWKLGDLPATMHVHALAGVRKDMKLMSMNEFRKTCF